MRKKCQRLIDNTQRSNIIEPGKSYYQQLKGLWRSKYFHNSHDLVVELGCGQGAYTVGLAQQFPQKNFVGVDIKGARLWVGSSYALANGLHQVAFLRSKVEQLREHFAPQEISTLYLTFPDPRPQGRDTKRRLTSPRFLALYRQLLQPEGFVYLKTDSDDLFSYTLAVLRTQTIKKLIYTEDLYRSEWLSAHYGIQTAYEKRFLRQGATIKYLRFAFDTPENKIEHTKQPTEHDQQC